MLTDFYATFACCCPIQSNRITPTPPNRITPQQARAAYDKCIDRVETQLPPSLPQAATTKADDMFRVFSKFNALFFRPRIRGDPAVSDGYEQVKSDVTGLQLKFKSQHGNRR